MNSEKNPNTKDKHMRLVKIQSKYTGKMNKIYVIKHNLCGS